MLADGQYVDGSWLLTIHIDELNIDKQVRVLDDWSIGEVITQLINGLPVPVHKLPGSNEISLRSGGPRAGWLDYGLWWPAKCKWLLRTQANLTQYGLQADAWLRFVPIYGRLRVQLPDHQIREFVDINYSEPVFRVTLAICRYLNIRHPEELSLAHSITQSELKHSRFVPGFIDRRCHTLTAGNKRSTLNRSATVNVTHSLFKNSRRPSLPQSMKENETPNLSAELPRKGSSISSHTSVQLFGPPRVRDKRSGIYYHQLQTIRKSRFDKITNTAINSTDAPHNCSPNSMQNLIFELRILEDPMLYMSPHIDVEDALDKGYIVRPSNYIERVRLNALWLDSSRSLLEQGIDLRANLNGVDYTFRSTMAHITSPIHSNGDTQTEVIQVPTINLRYKYGLYYDLNIKYDAIRINQLYEQAKWSILSEIFDVTDDEACLFAALQAQAEMATEHESLWTDETDSKFDYQNGSTAKSNADRISKKLINLTHARDLSPLGTYSKYYRSPIGSIKSSPRPLSTIELESEIDAILDEMTENCLESQTDGSGLSRSSRSRQQSPRPLSMADGQLVPDEPGLPELNGYVKICKPRRFGLKVYRRFFIVLKNLDLLVYKSQEDFQIKSDANEVIHLPGCEVQPDICLTSEKYILRLFVPITRTNLPLSTAFQPIISMGQDSSKENDESGLSSKLRRRASLLSLTSLSHLTSALGLVTNSPTTNSQAISGLNRISSSVVGLVHEIWIRFSDLDSYMTWLAGFRLTSSAPIIGTGDMRKERKKSNTNRQFVTETMFNAELKAIKSLINLLKPIQTKQDQSDHTIDTSALYNKLDKGIVNYLPLRIGLHKNLHKIWDLKKDQIEHSMIRKSATIGPQDKPPISPSMGQSNQLKYNLMQRIASMYTKVHTLSSIQAKLKYINVWEQLPFHGVAFFPAKVEVTVPWANLVGAEYFVNQGDHYIPGINRTLGSGNVTVSTSRRLESIGISPTRLFRCDLTNGDILATWRLSSIQGWHINWELNEVILVIANPSEKKGDTQQGFNIKMPDYAGRVIIRPIDVSVRTVAEFLGGYTFLNLRSPEKNQCLVEDVFYKLTTGVALPV